MAMLIYLSCQGEPRQILNQLEVNEMQEPGGRGRMVKLLEESFGARADERFEEKQDAYLNCRRAPGQSIAAYISIYLDPQAAQRRVSEGGCRNDSERQELCTAAPSESRSHEEGADGYLLLQRKPVQQQSHREGHCAVAVPTSMWMRRRPRPIIAQDPTGCWMSKDGHPCGARSCGRATRGGATASLTGQAITPTWQMEMSPMTPASLPRMI